MCDCPAHQSLVDCTCSCDHTNDRLLQLRNRVRELEADLGSAQNAFRFNALHRWRWLESTLDLQMRSFGYDFPMTGEELGDFVRTNTTAIVAELGEALKEIGWKPWSVGQGYVNREAYLGELVDAGHFLANLLVAVGITDDEWEAAYRRKQLVNRDRQAAGYDTRVAKCPACGRAYDDTATDCTPEFTDPGLGTVPYCEDYGVLETTGK